MFQCPKCLTNQWHDLESCAYRSEDCPFIEIRNKELAGGRGIGLFLLAFALIWLGIALSLLVSVAGSEDPQVLSVVISVIVLSVVGIIGFVVLWLALLILLAREQSFMDPATGVRWMKVRIAGIPQVETQTTNIEPISVPRPLAPRSHAASWLGLRSSIESSQPRYVREYASEIALWSLLDLTAHQAIQLVRFESEHRYLGGWFPPRHVREIVVRRGDGNCPPQAGTLEQRLLRIVEERGSGPFPEKTTELLTIKNLLADCYEGDVMDSFGKWIEWAENDAIDAALGIRAPSSKFIQMFVDRRFEHAQEQQGAMLEERSRFASWVLAWRESDPEAAGDISKEIESGIGSRTSSSD